MTNALTGRIITALLLIPSLLFLNTCTRSHSSVNTEVPLKFLFVPGVSDPFYYTMEKGAREKALELGVELTVSRYPKYWGPEEQIQVLNEITRHNDWDLIFISPTADEALIEPLKVLFDRGIEIITVDTKIGDGDYSVPGNASFPLSHIGTDNLLGGLKIAEQLAEITGEKGKVYVNTTTPETSTTEERKEGFLEGISRFPDMEVIRIDYNGDIQYRAEEQTLSVLQAEPDIAGIFATNVFSSQGVSLAVSNSGLSGAIKIAAWDASKTLIDALKNGEVDLVLGQKPRDIGAMAVEWGYRYFRENEIIPKKIVSGFLYFTRANVNDPEMIKHIYSRQER